MSEITLAVIEMIFAGIAVHSWDTGNIAMVFGSVMLGLMFLSFAVIDAVEEVRNR